MTLIVVLLILALVLTPVSAVDGRVPLWVAVLFIVLALLIQNWGR